MTILKKNVWQIIWLFIELNGWVTRETQIRDAEVAKEEQEWLKGADTRHNYDSESGGRE